MLALPIQTLLIVSLANSKNNATKVQSRKESINSKSKELKFDLINKEKQASTTKILDETQGRIITLFKAMDIPNILLRT